MFSPPPPRRYKYIDALREAFERDKDSDEAGRPGKAIDAATLRAIEGSTVIRLQGHLFDTGLINAALDVVETAGGRFDLLEVTLKGGGEGRARRHTAATGCVSLHSHPRFHRTSRRLVPRAAGLRPSKRNDQHRLQLGRASQVVRAHAGEQSPPTLPPGHVPISP